MDKESSRDWQLGTSALPENTEEILDMLHSTLLGDVCRGEEVGPNFTAISSFILVLWDRVKQRQSLAIH